MPPPTYKYATRVDTNMGEDPGVRPDGPHADPPSGFELVFGGIRPVVLRVARKHVDSLDEAEDVTQEAYLRAFRAFARYNGGAPLTYMVTILIRIVVERRREAQRLRNGLCRMDAEDLASEYDVFENLLARERTSVVVAAISKLPAGQRRVVELVVLGGMTAREAAEELGISVECVKNRLHEARAKLKSTLGSGLGD